ncbi:MAG TPA: prolyl oligopeptidase family serine peptidase, partial [Candidatus Limnocylindrales bacterium]
ADYGIDEDRFFAFGTSYGGTLVDLLALTGPRSAFDTGPYLEQSSAVRAVVDMFGPADLPGWISADGLRRIFGGDEAELPLASPAHYVAAGAPPILIVQGAEDTTVPPSQSSELYQRLCDSGDRTQLVLVQHMGHMFEQVGGLPIDPGLPQIAHDMVAFFADAAARP